jgi:hypothetical protein
MRLDAGNVVRCSLRGALAGGLFLALLALAPAQPPGPAAEQPESQSAAPRKRGLLRSEPGSFAGYTLIAPMRSNETYLVDMQGHVVHTWTSECTPALCAYLLENGNLLRPGSDDGPASLVTRGPGAGGRVQEFTWDGELVWDYSLLDESHTPHHDIERLPNGNVLLIVWEHKTRDEAIAAGRKPELVGDGEQAMKPDSLLEIKPTGKTTGEVVWEWHVWDHLIQDHDSTRANYGNVAAHPELVDINFVEDPQAAAAKDSNLSEPGRPLGNVLFGAGPTNPDWTHVNAVAFNAELDQIVLSVHAFSEVWIIDHSTTTDESAGHTGGRSGKGGDLLYRWGNPRAYRAGTTDDQKLYKQHDAHWIPSGHPGGGHLLIFNNGNRRPQGEYSSIDELVLPVDAQGRYALSPGKLYEPDEPVWSYVAPEAESFYSMLISGAQRLANGNTLICEGLSGRVFEVTPANITVWEFVNPIQDDDSQSGPGGPRVTGRFAGPGAPGRGPGPFELPRIGQVMPTFLQDVLQLSKAQRQQIDALHQSIDEALTTMLFEGQRESLEEIQRRGPFAFGFPQPGQIMSSGMQERLKLNVDQQQKLKTLETDVDRKVREILDERQRKQLDEIANFARRGLGGPPGAGGPGPGGPGIRRGGPSPSSLFRAYRYAPDYPGLSNKKLTPGRSLEAIAQEKNQQREQDEQRRTQQEANDGSRDDQDGSPAAAAREQQCQEPK